jgi:hypothetical protein
MQLTPQQQAQIRAAKEAGETRATVEFTSEQKQEWEAAVAAELAGKEENITHHQKIQNAAREPGFIGDVRRAITFSRRPVSQLAADLDIDERLLSDFRAGDAGLPSAALAKLVDILGLRLMQEIPPSAGTKSVP